MLEKLKQTGKTFSESWTACCLAMVQGDLSVLTLGHAMTAARTGILASVVMFVALFIKNNPSKWFIAWLTGIATAFSDILVHPSHFGTSYTEAIATGVGAFFLAYMVEEIRNGGKDK